MIMGIAFVVALLSGVIEASMLMTSATSGPLLGVFLLAMFCPPANWKVVYQIHLKLLYSWVQIVLYGLFTSVNISIFDKQKYYIYCLSPNLFFLLEKPLLHTLDDKHKGRIRVLLFIKQKTLGFIINSYLKYFSLIWNNEFLFKRNSYTIKFIFNNLILL